MAKGSKNRSRRAVSTPSLRYSVAPARVPRSTVFHRPRPSPVYPSTPIADRILRSPPQMPLQMVEDRRLFHPAARLHRPVISITNRSAARVVAKQNPKYRAPSQTKAILTFAEPQKLPLCLRRSIRKQVLHAKGVAGQKHLRPPRRNQWSSISCRS